MIQIIALSTELLVVAALLALPRITRRDGRRTGVSRVPDRHLIGPPQKLGGMRREVAGQRQGDQHCRERCHPG